MDEHENLFDQETSFGQLKYDDQMQFDYYNRYQESPIQYDDSYESNNTINLPNQIHPLNNPAYQKFHTPRIQNSNLPYIRERNESDLSSRKHPTSSIKSKKSSSSRGKNQKSPKKINKKLKSTDKSKKQKKTETSNKSADQSLQVQQFGGGLKQEP